MEYKYIGYKPLHQLTMGLTKVSTDGVKDDAITKSKIPANQIEASELADNAVDTNAIADQAVALSKLPHGDGSSDGKFLRANNGADPSFETVTSTTINNNADNRVITGSGSANTLNGESSVVIDSTGQVSVGGSTTAFDTTGSLNGLQGYYETDSGIATIGSYSSGGSTVLNFHTNSGGGASAERMRIDSSGRVGIGTNNPTDKLHVVGTTNLAGNSYLTNAYVSGSIYLGGTGAANALDDYEEGSWTATCASGGSSFTNDSNNNKYVKIGSMVFITGEVYGLSNPNNNTFEVGGLPYQIAQSREGTGSIMCNNINFVGRTMATIYIYASQTKFRIYTSGNATSWRASTGTDFSVSGDIIFSFAYQTTAQTELRL